MIVGKSAFLGGGGDASFEVGPFPSGTIIASVVVQGQQSDFSISISIGGESLADDLYCSPVGGVGALGCVSVTLPLWFQLTRAGVVAINVFNGSAGSACSVFVSIHRPSKRHDGTGVPT